MIGFHQTLDHVPLFVLGTKALQQRRRGNGTVLVDHDSGGLD
jgi:hypothetical protein